MPIRILFFCSLSLKNTNYEQATSDEKASRHSETVVCNYVFGFQNKVMSKDLWIKGEIKKIFNSAFQGPWNKVCMCMRRCRFNKVDYSAIFKKLCQTTVSLQCRVCLSGANGTLKMGAKLFCFHFD